MAVTIVSNEDKVEMFLDNSLSGLSLTSIGETYGVSRKTVRRCIDEVFEVYSSIRVGDRIKYLDASGNITTDVVDHVDSRMVDKSPVCVKIGGYIPLHRIMSCDQSPQVEAHEAQSGESVKVKIIPQNCLYSFGEDSDFSVVFTATFDNERGLYHISGDQLLFAGCEYFFEDKDYAFFKESLEFVNEQESQVKEDDADYYVTAPQDSITIVRIDRETGEVTQRQTNKHNPNFTNLRNELKQSQSQETLQSIYNELDTKLMLESYSVGRVKIDPEAESVVFVKPDGTERKVPDDIACDIISTVREYGKASGAKLVKFLDKLMDNTSFQAIEGLYRFMKHNCISINEDGSIEAWKGVRDDLYDKHSGTIYNGNFGTEIRVDRSEVDDNPDQTCSYGLHVGNRDYASSWASTLLRVKVEPQDVVAVPKDYNGAKMRCCAYTPIEVVA